MALHNKFDISIFLVERIEHRHFPALPPLPPFMPAAPPTRTPAAVAFHIPEQTLMKPRHTKLYHRVHT